MPKLKGIFGGERSKCDSLAFLLQRSKLEQISIYCYRHKMKLTSDGGLVIGATNASGDSMAIAAFLKPAPAGDWRLRTFGAIGTRFDRGLSEMLRSGEKGNAFDG